MTAILTALGTAVPEYKISQSELVPFMSKLLKLDHVEERKLSILYRATGIQHRHSVIPDFEKKEQLEFFREDDLDFSPPISQRMQYYEKSALGLAKNAVLDAFQGLEDEIYDEITHLITVSCTGMYAPGLDIELVQELPLKSSIQRTAVNFMGCYGAFNALKLAKSICEADKNSKVLVVSVELCTLHFQHSKDEEQLLAASLFADGSAAALVEGKVDAPRKFQLELNTFFADLVPQGKTEMQWHIEDHGFKMGLTTLVPELIRDEMDVLIQNLFSKSSANQDEVDFYAIHPGGKKILQEVEKKLGITKEQNAVAHEVLRDYGNMSSATILFVLKKLLTEINEVEEPKIILGMAFGPGLTIESMIVRLLPTD
ncbi:type III polyketide synthase [Sediminitomix flava]|uniref:Putative naringenin-chalcone synthase n=1 Tax=Sediminitomix flava TaxID=379075 RepID=A0A315ZAK1_SEDFL|nr:type III polyketide synthase [Sediminitomix flava]PWJ42169.1 putative naringenin-chalcone synthase [Sediminitomix flava]